MFCSYDILIIELISTRVLFGDRILLVGHRVFFSKVRLLIRSVVVMNMYYRDFDNLYNHVFRLYQKYKRKIFGLNNDLESIIINTCHKCKIKMFKVCFLSWVCINRGEESSTISFMRYLSFRRPTDSVFLTPIS